MLPFNEVFDENLKYLEEAILSHENDENMVNTAEAFLLRHLPRPEPRIEEINRIVQCIMDEKTILKVDNLIERFSYSKRTLQRLFRQYVGVSPKWIIQRYRLHEGAEQMASGQAENWPALAVDLGYFDQAHFIRDFKAIVGQSPAEYARRQ
jgi:AraC-like DNA-binding protein